MIDAPHDGLGASLGAALLGGLLALVQSGATAAPQPPSARFEDVKALVRTSYVRPVADRDLEYSAMRGLASSLDAYSSFLSPDEARAFRDDVEGRLSGIGIEITVDEKGYLSVIAPLEDTPAWRAGVLPGDRIVEIDGRPVELKSPGDGARLIKGPPGTTVTLTVVHAGASHPEELKITRQAISVRSVKRPHIVDPDNGIGYVRITQFESRTALELRDAIAALRARGARSLVLDLRSNPGGPLDAAVGVVELFVSSGTVVVTRSRDSSQDRTYEAHAPAPLADLPLAVLVNGASASASEIVAGALKDAGRAAIVGSRTYGKGSVQSLIPLRDPSGEALLKLTTARWYTRSGRPIQREPDAKEGDAWGIEPDRRVALDARRLRDIFGKRDALDAHEAGAGSGAVDIPADPQLDVAADILRPGKGR